MPQCVCFVSFNGKTPDAIRKTPIFWVIFGWNRGIWPPGVSIYRDPSYCLVNYFEETLSCFISKVFLWLFCLTKWFKLRFINKKCIFLLFTSQKYEYLIPCGSHIERYSVLFGDSFERNAIMHCFKCHNMTALHHIMVIIWEVLAICQYLCYFWSK